MLFSSLRNAFPHMVFSQSPEQHSYKVSPSLKILKREQFLIPPFWLSLQHTQRVFGQSSTNGKESWVESQGGTGPEPTATHVCHTQTPGGALL